MFAVGNHLYLNIHKKSEKDGVTVKLQGPIVVYCHVA
jgi:hypothetical protein